MVPGLNWVDLIILGVITLFALEAVGRPVIIEVLDLVSFILAGILSFSYFNFPAKYFEREFLVPHGLSLVLGFITVWFLSEIILYLIARIFLPRILRIKIAGSIFLSVIPAALRSLIFIAVVLVLIATFPIQPNIKKEVLNSRLGSRILKYAYNLETPIKQVFGGVANDSLSFLTIKPKTYEKINLGFQTDKIEVDELSENSMTALVNQERMKAEVKPLVFDAKLREIARSYSADMLKRGYFSHYSPEGKSVADRALTAGIDFLVVGENLAYAPTVESAHKGFMNSAGHRANILSTDYGKIGIGAIDGGVYGKMFTQVFTN